MDGSSILFKKDASPSKKMHRPTAFFILVPTQIKPQAVEREKISKRKGDEQKPDDQTRSCTGYAMASVGCRGSGCGFAGPRVAQCGGHIVWSQLHDLKFHLFASGI